MIFLTERSALSRTLALKISFCYKLPIVLSNAAFTYKPTCHVLAVFNSISGIGASVKSGKTSGPCG